MKSYRVPVFIEASIFIKGAEDKEQAKRIALERARQVKGTLKTGCSGLVEFSGENKVFIPIVEK